MVKYYETGDLQTFDQYTIVRVENIELLADLVNSLTSHTVTHWK